MNRLFNRRLEILKEIGIDGLHISKKGNYYVYLNKKSSDKTIIKTWYNVTKKQIGEVGEELTFPRSNNHLVLLTTNNKLYVDIGNGLKKLGFQGIIHTAYRNKLAKLYFYNKKYEWLLNYPQFDRLRIARQCNSLKELKHFFGYGFMSNSQFVNRFGTDEGLELLVLSHNIENKVAIANTKTPIQYLRDIMNMSKTLQEDIQIHKSESRNRQTHDYLVGLTTLKSSMGFSDKEINVNWQLLDVLDNLKIQYDLLNSPRKLFVEGQRQHHCISSYSRDLDKSTFLSIIWEGERHSVHFRNGKVAQIKKAYNKSANQGLVEFLNKHIYVPTITSVISNETKMTLQEDNTWWNLF